MQNIKKQIKGVHIGAPSNNDKHMKGEKELSDLTQSIKFMLQRFDKFKKDRREKVNEDLLEKVSVLSSKVEKIEKHIGKPEQYSRQDCLLIHCIQENLDENTDENSNSYVT